MNQHLAHARMDAVARPSETILAGDARHPFHDATYWVDPWVTRPAPVHAGGANILFVDGSVRWMRHEDIPADSRSPEGVRFWVGLEYGAPYPW